MTEIEEPVAQPEVSVLLPVRNGEEFVKQSVQSILHQTFRDFELLVIDDGSEDRTIEVLESLKDSRLSVIKNNGDPGLVGALNAGISLARGNFIARIDHDDVARPNRLEVQTQAFRNNPNVGLVGSWITTIGDSSRLIKFPVSSDHVRFSICSGNPMAHPSVMFRTNWDHGQKGYYDPKFSLAEDYEMWTRVISQWDAINIPIPLTQYRIHPRQITAHQQNERRQCARQIAGREAYKVGYRGFPENASILQEYLWWKGLLKCPGLEGEGNSASRRCFLRVTLLAIIKAHMSRHIWRTVKISRGGRVGTTS